MTRPTNKRDAISSVARSTTHGSGSGSGSGSSSTNSGNLHRNGGVTPSLNLPLSPSTSSLNSALHGVNAAGVAQRTPSSLHPIPSPLPPMSLPTSLPMTPASPEQALLASFKAAALSVTQLYKDSQRHHRAEHAKGYEAGLQDLLAFVSNHPLVLEKSSQGQSEEAIRQGTSISVDDMVNFAQAAHRCRQQQGQQEQQDQPMPVLQQSQSQVLHLQQSLHYEQQNQPLQVPSHHATLPLLTIAQEQPPMQQQPMMQTSPQSPPHESHRRRRH